MIFILIFLQCFSAVNGVALEVFSGLMLELRGKITTFFRNCKEKIDLTRMSLTDFLSSETEN